MLNNLKFFSWYVWKCIKCVFSILGFHTKMYHPTTKFGSHLINLTRPYLKPSSKYIKWKIKLFFLYIHLFKYINYEFEIERTYNCFKCSLLYMNKNTLNPLIVSSSFYWYHLSHLSIAINIFSSLNITL